MKAVGEVYRAMAPGNFTYSSYSAMFMGFTPGVAERAEPFVNPKYGKIFKMVGAGFPGKGTEHITLEGRNIIDGFKRKGYHTIGTCAVGWFDPQTEIGRDLTKDFDKYYFPGNSYSLSKQIDWTASALSGAERPVFVFMNIGETHVPYYYDGAPWSMERNPCVPFSRENDAAECRRRQRACVEYVDGLVAPIIEAFRKETTVICSDHGDCWGEDGLWEHGIHHEKVLEVPLIFRLNK
jgi:glucan phosphoethanolaminetransferase (alkaline phosphatase superfamily)